MNADQGPTGTAAVGLQPPPLVVCSLGVVPYEVALDRQRRLVKARQADETPDHLLLLEHPAVITIGVRGRAHPQHLLASRADLRQVGIDVHDVARGGDVTYHGPGQIVGYPVVSLKPDRCDVRRYVTDLEEVLIRTAAGFGVEAGRVAGLTGVWVGNDKLAAIGVRLSRWVTSHGFALNVATNLDHFRFIVPCGLEGRGVTSLDRLLRTPPSQTEAAAVLATEFARVFGRRVVT